VASLAVSVRFILFFSLLAITGCKVVLEVPTGGVIVSESGAYECGEQQSCVIDVEDVNFDETFVATPREDYDFVGWKKRPRGLCSAPDRKTEPCPVTTAALAQAPELLELLDMDISVYLEPEFVIREDATIIFPTENTVATDTSLFVRGTASDPDGVMAVHVNDAAATLTPMVMDAGKAYPTKVAWQAYIRIQDGNSQIRADVTDGDGIVSRDSASVAIDLQRVPIDFAFDAANNRVLGAFFGDGLNYDLVAMDLDTGETSTITDRFDSLLPTCLKPDTGELLHIDMGQDDQVAIHSYDLDTGIDSIVSSALLEPAQDVGATIEVRSLACGSGIDEAYLTYNYIYRDSPNVSTGETEDFSYITAFNIVTGEGRLLSTIVKRGDWDFPLYGARMVGDQLVAWRLATFVSIGNPLLLIDRETGEDSFFGWQNYTSIVDIAPDPLTGTLYITYINGVFEIPAGTTEYLIVSFDGNEDELLLSNPLATASDADNNRVLVGDLGLQTVIAVDVTNGNREALNKQLGGAGEPLDRPIKMQVIEDYLTAYVLDSQLGQKPRLVEVDLDTGDKKTIGDISRYWQQQGAGLAVDEEAGKVYLAFSEDLLEMDLATEQARSLARVGTGAIFSSLADIALDKANNRLLIADSEANTLLAMDLDSNVRSLVSAEGSRGGGPELTGVTSLAVDIDRNTAFATITEPNRIVAIDLDSGDRQIVLDSCLDEQGINRLGQGLQPENLFYHDGKLRIAEWTLMTLDVESGSCTVNASPKPNISSMSNIRDSDDLLYVTALNYRGLGVLDADTGEFVLLAD